MGAALQKFRAKHDEGEKRVSTVAIKHGDHVLLGKRRDNGKWTTPGGHLEAGEDHHAGALREVKEESGIDLHPEQVRAAGPVRRVSKPNGKTLHVQGFIANLDDRPPTSMGRDPDAEVHRWQWVDVSKGLPKDIAENLHVPMKDNVLRHELGHKDEGENMSMLGKYMARSKARGGAGPEELTGSPLGHGIRKEEGEDIGAEPHEMDSLHSELAEPASHKGKLAPEHARILGLHEGDGDDDDY